MKGLASAALVGLLSLTASSPERFIPLAFSAIRAGLAAAATSITPPAGHALQEVVWRMDFSDYVGDRLRRGSKPQGSDWSKGQRTLNCWRCLPKRVP
jgi:hypothetical protein